MAHLRTTEFREGFLGRVGWQLGGSGGCSRAGDDGWVGTFRRSAKVGTRRRVARGQSGMMEYLVTKDQVVLDLSCVASAGTLGPLCVHSYDCEISRFEMATQLARRYGF